MTTVQPAHRPLMRPEIAAMPPHQGRPLPPEVIRLAANEVAYGPLPGVAEAVAAATAGTHRYPEWDALTLRTTLARRCGAAPQQVAMGCGLTAVLEHLIRATCAPGDEVVYAWPSFEAYPVIAALSGVVAVPVPLTARHGHDLEAMAAAITDRTRLVIICNPNNPTGTALRAEELTAFLDAVPADVLVAIDEAYREFVTDTDIPDGWSAFGDRPNVAVLRTFSKAWGMAGLRVGFLLASEYVATTVRTMITPFSVNAAATAAATAALLAEPEMRRRTALVAADRDRIAAVTAPLGAPASQANFVWLPLGEHAAAFGEACSAAGIAVRTFPGIGVRVTVGTSSETDTFLAVLAAHT